MDTITIDRTTKDSISYVISDYENLRCCYPVNVVCLNVKRTKYLLFNYFLGVCLKKNTTINQTKPVGQTVYIVKLYDNNILPYEVKNNVFFSRNERLVPYILRRVSGIGRIVITLGTRHFTVHTRLHLHSFRVI